MPNQQLHSEAAVDAGARTISKQVEIDGLIVKLEALVTGNEFGGGDESGRARWAAAGFRLTPHAATLADERGSQRLELTTETDARRSIVAGIVLTPMASVLAMLMARAWRLRRNG